MEFRHLDITVVSAEDLKDVNIFTKMSVYAVVYVSGDAYSKQKTPVHKGSGKNPIWNHRMRFTINELVLKQNPNLTIHFKLKSARPLGDREVGDVYVPIKDLLDQAGNRELAVQYGVRRPNGKSKGRLMFSCKFGEKFTTQGGPPPNIAAFKGTNGKEEPVLAYPPPQFYNHAAARGSNTVYPPPPSQPGVGYPYPPPPTQPAAGYAYPPKPTPSQGYGGNSGYPPQGSGGYYQYPQNGPQAQTAIPQKPKKGGMGMGMGMGMGLGAGLLGGFLLGEMAEGAADYGYNDYDCDYGS